MCFVSMFCFALRRKQNLELLLYTCNKPKTTTPFSEWSGMNWKMSSVEMNSLTESMHPSYGHNLLILTNCCLSYSYKSWQYCKKSPLDNTICLKYILCQVLHITFCVL